MSAFFTDKIADITIANGATKSRLVGLDEYQDARKLLIQTPHDIGGKTYSYMVTHDQEPNITTGSWATLVDSTGTAYSPAAIDKSIAAPDELLSATAFYILASADPGKDVAFGASKQWLA